MLLGFVPAVDFVDGSQDTLHVFLGATPHPELLIDFFEIAAWDKLQGLPICQRLGLKVGKVREDPYVPQFVSDCGIQLPVVQRAEKLLFKRYLIFGCPPGDMLHGGKVRVCTHNYDDHLLGNT